MSQCHDPAPTGSSQATPALPLPASPLLLGVPRPALVLGVSLALVALVSSAWIAVSPFDAATFGGLTVPIVLVSGFADGLNPCAFALLVLFATYTLTLVNSVTADGSPTMEARRRLLGAGSLYVGAVWITPAMRPERAVVTSSMRTGPGEKLALQRTRPAFPSHFSAETEG